MNKEIETIQKKIYETKHFDEIMPIVKDAIEQAIQQERQRLTSIVKKEIVKSDKYNIAPLQRIMCEINKYENI